MKPHITSFLVVSLATLAMPMAACPEAPVKPTENEAPPPDSAPLPFTADEIRKAMPVGSKIWMEIDQGGKKTREEWEVTEADRETCTMTSKLMDEAGKLIKDEGATTYRWTELRNHAAFPVNNTQRAEGKVSVPIGTFDSWLYVVDTVNADGFNEVSYYHFAKTLPGPPVMMSKTVDGKTVMTMTMVGRQ